MSTRRENLKVGRERIAKLFQYLEALSQLRNPDTHDVTGQPWHFWLQDLPKHPSILSGKAAEGDLLLSVRRPEAARPAPNPPESIASWLNQGWEDPFGDLSIRKAKVAKSENGVSIVAFDSNPIRVSDFENWSTRRAGWSIATSQAERARQLFGNLFSLYEQLQREGEKVELFLGDGILSWGGTEGGIYHPLLLQRATLDFDPQLPELTISLGDAPIEFHSSPLQALPGINGRALASIRKELEARIMERLDSEDIPALLRSLTGRLSAHAEFRSGKALRSNSDRPVLTQSPVLFLRKRNASSNFALKPLLADLSSNKVIPSSLLRIVGVDDREAGEAEPAAIDWMDELQPANILLSKPANAQQIRIARRLDEHGSVLVQGPPGTGKTHTIANLIGHLLAQGKTILITSHASKALRVLRDQVVPELRPLCASLLDSDAESQAQLGQSIEAIVTRLSFDNATRLENQSLELERQRHALIAQLRSSFEQTLIARASEYQGIAVGDVAYAPSDAARIVRAGAGKLEFIPSPVKQGAAIPLADAELKELYQTNKLLSAEDEAACSRWLPDPNELIPEADFSLLVAEQRKLVGKELFRGDLWAEPARPDDLQTLNALRQEALAASEAIQKAEPWQAALMLAGHPLSPERTAWQELLALAKQTSRCAVDCQDEMRRAQPELPEKLSTEEAFAAAEAILNHLEAKGELTLLVLLTRPKWKALVQGSRVASQKPKSIEDFRALRSMADLQRKREQLTAHWNTQVSSLGIEGAEISGAAPEEVCYEFAKIIERYFSWQERQWTPLLHALESAGLQFQTLLNEQSPTVSEQFDLQPLADLLAGQLQEILTSRCVSAALAHINAALADVRTYLETGAGYEAHTGVTASLLEVVRNGSPKAYAKAMALLQELHARRRHLGRRDQLLQTLAGVAPEWAEAIRQRKAPHGGATCPARVKDAWLWRQLSDALEGRSTASLEGLEVEIASTQSRIQQVTAELIEKRAWAAQIRRTENNHRQKQALVGWLDTVKKIGKGTGVRAPKLKAQANRLMTECRGAVPVWIMPMSRVVENFDPANMKFDVVIVDEASQSDVTGLAALYYAHQAIVVGDHEQVSPSAVGQELTTVQHLIDEHLDGIPNAHLYDGQTSLYDLARASFGGTIRLVEHFRCVPEIIQFSNQLSYEGAIWPLRDTSQVVLQPAVVAHQVENASAAANKVNEEEALEIAALVIAASEQPEYAQKSFGVISLVGDEQADRIDDLIRKYKIQCDFGANHKLLCGTPAQFQGDERDVVFLSLVDSSDGDVLPLREQTMFKQRFNVAASRAKDQMWVIHSMDRSQLQSNDLRRRLIDHAYDRRQAVEPSTSATRVASPLVMELLSNLVGAGYLVTPQVRVGAHIIDLVVEGNKKRVAIACDGDKDYSFEELQEDLFRQTVLARLGWSFIHVQGSHYFSDPEATMTSVTARLALHGIEPSATLPLNEDTEPLEDVSVRVKLRAKELRNEWREPVEAKSRRTRKTRDTEFQCATTS